MTRRSFPLATVSRVARAVLLAGLVVPVMLAAGASSPETALLERAGERVKQFWEQLSSVACTENVLQEKLNEKGKVVLNGHASYDYLISLRWDNGGMLVDESRLPIGPPQKKTPQGVLLSTQGFATLLMIFHPQFQPSYSFTLQGEEEVAGRKLVRVGFLPRNGAPSPAVLSLKGRNYPIAWEGTAWIDPELAMVVRLEAHWKDPAEEIGLQSLSSEVQYAPIPFRGQTQPFWLATVAKIDVQTQHQHWRNTHQFSKYRLFNVDTESTVGDAPVTNK